MSCQGIDLWSGLAKPAAFVVVNPDFCASDELARELQDWAAQQLAGYKRPRWIEFLPELPKTATGKLQRFKLRALEQQERASTGHAPRPAAPESE